MTVMAIPQHRDCLMPSCVDAAEPGRQYCRRHDDRREAALAGERAAVGALAAMDAGEPQQPQQPVNYRREDADGLFGCKIPGCRGRAERNRGALAYLCDRHADEKQRSVDAAQAEGMRRRRERFAPPAEPDSEPSGLAVMSDEPSDPLMVELFSGVQRPEDLRDWADALTERADRQRKVADALDTLADGARKLADLL